MAGCRQTAVLPAGRLRGSGAEVAGAADAPCDRQAARRAWLGERPRPAGQAAPTGRDTRRLRDRHPRILRAQAPHRTEGAVSGAGQPALPAGSRDRLARVLSQAAHRSGHRIQPGDAGNADCSPAAKAVARRVAARRGGQRSGLHRDDPVPGRQGAHGRRHCDSAYRGQGAMAARGAHGRGDLGTSQALDAQPGQASTLGPSRS